MLLLLVWSVLIGVATAIVHLVVAGVCVPLEGLSCSVDRFTLVAFEVSRVWRETELGGEMLDSTFEAGTNIN